MTIRNGYVDWATNLHHRVSPTADWRHWPKANSSNGITGHSSEGHLEGAIGEMLNPARVVCMVFFVESAAGHPDDGKLFQFYEVTRSTYLSSDRWANENTWGVEVGGFATEPITPAAIATLKRLFEEWERFAYQKARRLEPGRNMYQHSDWTATSCPSGRWDPIWEWLENREEDMTPQEVIALIDARLRYHDLRGPGVPTLKRLAEASVNRWAVLYDAAGLTFGKWTRVRKAADPLKVPEYPK